MIHNNIGPWKHITSNSLQGISQSIPPLLLVVELCTLSFLGHFLHALHPHFGHLSTVININIIIPVIHHNPRIRIKNTSTGKFYTKTM